MDETAHKTAEDRSQSGSARERLSRVRDLRLKGYPRPLDRPYAVMTGALFVQAVLHGVTALLEIGAPGAIGLDIEGRIGPLGHLYRTCFFVLGLAIPLGCFYWMRWVDWSVKNRLVATEGRFGRSPGAVVWAYFVPGLNLIKPLLDLQRLWRAASRFGGEAPSVLTVWWVVTLAHLALMAFALLSDRITAMTAASSALGALSNALALAVLRVFWQVQPHAPRQRGESEAADLQGVPA